MLVQPRAVAQYVFLPRTLSALRIVTGH